MLNLLGEEKRRFNDREGLFLKLTLETEVSETIGVMKWYIQRLPNAACNKKKELVCA